ncbi:hypothetical protein TRIUR3_04074 [Triticum urartu]|uniref:Uncharacterized protein n=1 Tax=Triticum urartu TaxID=4572 RepID=M7ZZV6_TRIUA|nr:hypothetical protein TRIUR3_04074 [Triticum urartu]
MSRLTHDLMAEILSRVPYKSLCICKCVCPAWRDLIADPESRKKIVQSLAGFFYHIPADSAEPRGADVEAHPRPNGGDPLSRALQITLHLQVCVPCLARPHRRSGESEEDCAVPGRFLLPHPGRLCRAPRLGRQLRRPLCLPLVQRAQDLPAPPPPPLPLPPDSADCSFTLKDSCDGLFLTRIGTGTPELQFRYMVSNPATGEYTLLPHSGYAGNCCGPYLGFDSGVSTEEFHVFEFVEWADEHWVPPVVTGVNIYSSETGAWVAMEPKWDIQVSLCGGPPGVFHKGCLHLLIHLDGLAILDAQGLNWRTIPVPNFIDPSFSGFIGKSAGQLFYINSDDSEEGYGSTSFSTISVYVLSSGIYNWDASYLDDGCAHWILLHKLSDVIPKENFCLGWDLKVIGVHPHANIIFMADFNNNELLAYDLDHRETCNVIMLAQRLTKVTSIDLFPGEIAERILIIPVLWKKLGEKLMGNSYQIHHKIGKKHPYKMEVVLWRRIVIAFLRVSNFKCDQSQQVQWFWYPPPSALVLSMIRIWGPSLTVLTYKGYEINGNTFYTIAQDQKSTNQNSGVRFDAATESGKDTYYGYIVDIWELDYGHDFKVPLFKCKWVNLSCGGVHVDSQYGITTVDLKNLGYSDEPFVLTNDVAQVIYVKNMSTKPRKRKDKEANTSYDEPKRHIVLSGKRDILGVEGKTDMSEDYEKFHEIPPFNVKADPSILINDEDYPWLRRNKQMTQAKEK